jgi:hypothetical protein
MNPYTKDGEGTSVSAGSPWPLSPQAHEEPKTCFLPYVKNSPFFTYGKEQVCCGRWLKLRRKFLKSYLQTKFQFIFLGDLGGTFSYLNFAMRGIANTYIMSN